MKKKELGCCIFGYTRYNCLWLQGVSFKEALIKSYLSFQGPQLWVTATKWWRPQQWPQQPPLHKLFLTKRSSEAIRRTCHPREEVRTKTGQEDPIPVLQIQGSFINYVEILHFTMRANARLTPEDSTRDIYYPRSLIQALCVLQTYFRINIWPILTQNDFFTFLLLI